MQAGLTDRPLAFRQLVPALPVRLTVCLGPWASQGCCQSAGDAQLPTSHAIVSPWWYRQAVKNRTRSNSSKVRTPACL